MSYKVDFVNVSTQGLESSPFANQLAGLRANEARYFHNKYKADFVVKPAAEARELVEYVHKILLERDIVIASKPLEATELNVDGIRWTYVFYESGLSINVFTPWKMPRNEPLGSNFAWTCQFLMNWPASSSSLVRKASSPEKSAAPSL